MNNDEMKLVFLVLSENMTNNHFGIDNIYFDCF